MSDISIQNQTQLMSAIAKHILGEATGLKITGSPDKVSATKNVIIASKKLYEELNLSKPQIENIFRLVEEKKAKAEIFENKTGLRWTI